MTSTIKFLKVLTYKIRIILKYGNETMVPLNSLQYKMESDECTQTFSKLEKSLKKEVVVTRSLNIKPILIYTLSKFNFLFFYPIRKMHKLGGNREWGIDDHNMLRPKPSFHNLINVGGLFVLWMLTVFICGAQSNNGYGESMTSAGSIIGFSFLIAFLA